MVGKIYARAHRRADNLAGRDDDLDEQEVKGIIQDVLTKDADVIVLACTHYHWIKELILEEVGDKAIVLDPSDAISRRVSELLKG